MTEFVNVYQINKSCNIIMSNKFIDLNWENEGCLKYLVYEHF